MEDQIKDQLKQIKETGSEEKILFFIKNSKLGFNHETHSKLVMEVLKKSISGISSSPTDASTLKDYNEKQNS